MKKIIFVCYGGGHVKMLIPLIKIACHNSSYKVTVIAFTTAGSVLRANNIPYFGYKDFVDLCANHQWKEFGIKLTGDTSASSLVSYEESVAYHGINYAELVDTYGVHEAEKMYEQSGRQCFNPVNFFKVLLSHLQPNLVVATNSPRSEKAAIEAAGILNIKSICLVDMFALQEVKWIAKNSFASKVCVLNESVKAMFVGHGRSENDIIVTGNPAFDSLFDSAVIEQSKVILNRHKILPSRKVILYASQPEPEKHPFNELRGNPALPIDIELVLRDFIKSNDNFHLIVRYHPSENTSFQLQNNVSLSEKSENLHALIHAVDLVIVTASTVGLEAYLAGKPVVSVDNSIFTSDAPFSSMGISFGVSNELQLPNKINEVMGKNTQVSVPKVESCLASLKVFNVIEQVMV